MKQKQLAIAKKKCIETPKLVYAQNPQPENNHQLVCVIGDVETKQKAIVDPNFPEVKAAGVLVLRREAEILQYTQGKRTEKEVGGGKRTTYHKEGPSWCTRHQGAIRVSHGPNYDNPERKSWVACTGGHDSSFREVTGKAYMGRFSVHKVTAHPPVSIGPPCS